MLAVPVRIRLAAGVGMIVSAVPVVMHVMAGRFVRVRAFAMMGARMHVSGNRGELREECKHTHVNDPALRQRCAHPVPPSVNLLVIISEARMRQLQASERRNAAAGQRPLGHSTRRHLRAANRPHRGLF
ncbi:MAG: hypothetical protein NW205_10325 [Hyphomicrobiaceae bacterium]|nr:hypothetical protein [Hyphomicrobiaceae bacterium]